MNLKDYANAVRDLDSLRRVCENYGCNFNSKDQSCCPFHNEKTPSFSIKDKGDGAIWKCFGKDKTCGSGDIFNFVMKMENVPFVEAVKKVYKILGLPIALAPTKEDKLIEYLKTTKNHKGIPYDSSYFYRDEKGKPLYIKIKYKDDTGKDYRVYALFEQDDMLKVDYKGEYFKNTPKYIYNYPGVKNAIETGKNVYLVEGEKDADNLIAKGFVATTTKVGTKIDYARFKEQLKGAKIVFIGDTGEAGDEYRDLCWDEFKDNASSYKIVTLPGLKDLGDNKDVTDWLEAGHTKEELVGAIKKAKPLDLKEFGKYKYNGLYTYYIKKAKKEDEEDEVKVVYDGLLEIASSNTDIDTKEETLTLKSRMYGREAEININKGLLSKSTFAETINNRKGFIIEPKKAGVVQDYLWTHYKYLMKYNELVEKMTTNKIGWIKYDSRSTFVYPKFDLSLDGVVYHNKDNRIEDRFSIKGNVEDYFKNVLSPLLGTDIGVIGIAATIGSLLLEKLNVHESFILDIYGKNGRGKTILLFALASIFGNPRDYSQEWNSTKTAIISNASDLNNFPLMLDDTKKCANKEMIAEIVYSLSGGKDKARANQDGSSREQKTFKNLTISTGETSLLNYLEGESSGAGAYGRVISIDTDEYEIFNSKEEADKMANECKKNYGVFGYEFCKWLYELFNDADKAESVIEKYNNYRDENYEKVSHHTSIRKANHIALLQVAYDLLDDFLTSKNINLFVRPYVFSDLLETSEKLSKEQDVYLNAYEDVIEQCYMLQDRIHIASRDGSFPPPRVVGWLKDNIFYILDKELVKDILEQHGDTRDILKEWRSRGYLITDTNRLQRSARPSYKIDGKSRSVNTYAINTSFYNGSKKLEEEQVSLNIVK